MSDLNVVAVLKAKPGSEQVLGDALAALVEPTRAEEGCTGYELFVYAFDGAPAIHPLAPHGG